jgi:hypothetical protein
MAVTPSATPTPTPMPSAPGAFPAAQPIAPVSAGLNTTQLNPNIAAGSPSLYASALSSGLNTQQTNMVNQIYGTVQTYKALSTLPLQEAKTKYKQLSPESQSMIKDMYGKVEFTNTDNMITKVLKGTAGLLFDSLKSPIVALYRAAGAEQQLINAPYMFARELTQGESAFHLSTYSKAWNGKGIYDEGTVKNLKAKYGNAASYVAQSLIEGKKPGQILDGYGKVDGDIYNALADMYSNSKKFNDMMDEFRGAQVSVGRDAIRVIDHVNPKDSTFYTTNKWKMSTGAIDAFYEIAHDPLTYLGGIGLGVRGVKLAERGAEAATLGSHLAESLLTEPALRAQNAEEIFKPGSRAAQSWDTVFGPAVKQYHEANIARNADGVASAMENIRLKAPEINNRGLLDLLGEAKVFDAEGAKNFAKTMQGAQELHMGEVDGPTALRMGIPIARRERMMTAGFRKVVGDFFNGTATNAEIDALGGGNKVFDAFANIGRALDPVTGKPTYVPSPVLDDLTGHLNLRQRIARLAQTHPGFNEIGLEDSHAQKSVETVKQYLRLSGLPRYAANKTAEAYRFATPTERTVFVRGLYARIMNQMGVDENIRNGILERKFADLTAFANPKDLRVAPQHLDGWIQTDPLEHSPIEGNDALFKIGTNGPIHSFQGKPAIAGLNFQGAELAPYGFNFASKKSPMYVINNLIGGFARSSFIRKITNVWATGAIAPRMGVRGTIEQNIMHALTAPAANLTGYMKGRALNKAAIAYTGRTENIPFMSRVGRKALGKLPGIQKKFGIDLASWIPEKSIYQQISGKEMKVLQGRMDKGLVNGQEVWTVAQNDDIIHAIANRIDKLAGHDPETAAIFEKFLRHPTASYAAATNSVMARSAMFQGMKGGELEQQLLTDQGVARLLKEMDYVATGDWKYVNPKELASAINGVELSHAHYRAWAPMFQRFNTLDGFHFGENFIRHNALRTAADFANARAAILEKFGVDSKTLQIRKNGEAALDKYLNFSMQTSRDVAEKGWTKVQSAIHRIQIGLEDMYSTFHGSPIKFNDELFNAITDTAKSLAGKPVEGLENAAYGTGGAIRKALDMIQYDNFTELTRHFPPMEEFKSDLAKAEKGFWDKTPDDKAAALIKIVQNWGEGGVQNKILHYMDAQINWLSNQPIFDIAKVNLYKKYQPLERELYDHLIENGWSKEVARHAAETHFINLAEKNASQQVIKFMDNAAKQSVLSYTLRTAGRFFRAQEQFQRRIYRFKDYLPRAVFRMRLLHMGIDNMGMLHKDNNTNAPIFTMPGDNIIFHALNGGLNFIAGRDGSQLTTPMFADFNMNLLQSSPSLGPEAGMPAFSGPFISVPVVALKGLFNLGPWGWSKGIASELDKYLLGRANMSASKLLPVSLQRMLDFLPKDEADQQTASAMAMAVLYNAAHGYGNVTPKSIKQMSGDEYVTAAREYLNNVQVTANNVLALRAILGLISPMSPTMVEKGTIPKYLKDVGFSNLSQEYNDILQGVLRNDEGISDPYEIALGIFTRDFPGRTIYGVSKEEKSTKLLQSYTSDMDNWMMNNQKWVGLRVNADTAAASLIFAPHIGQFDVNTYSYLQSKGLIKQKPLWNYLQDVLTAQDYAAYDNARYRENLAAQTQSTDRPDKIKSAQLEQQAILASNPLLVQVMGDAKTSSTKYMGLFNALGDIVNNPNNGFPITKLEREKMQSAWILVNAGVQAMKNNTAANGYLNATATKAHDKQQILNAVAALGGAPNEGAAPVDAQIAEAMKSIFEPLLNSLSRTTVTVGLTK